MNNKRITYLCLQLFFLVISFNLVSQDTCEVERKLVAADLQAVEFLGGFNGVDISGNYAIAGAVGNNELGALAGAAHVFVKNGSEWTEMQKLIATDGSPNDRFGHSVAMWGDYAIVGAPFDDISGLFSGSAYIFHRIGQSWIQEFKISPTDGLTSDRFGWDVDIWEDYAVVSSLNDYTANQKATGSAYFFKREGDDWVEINKVFPDDGDNFDEFGSALYIKDDLAVIGSRKHNAGETNTGAAYVYENQDSLWVLNQKLVASDATGGAQFGNSVSISDSLVVVSAYNDIFNNVDTTGAVYVYRLGADSLVEEQKLITPETTFNMEFGISNDHNENRIALGTIKANTTGVAQSGAMFLYSYDGSSWVYDRKITANDAQNGDLYGISTALDGDFMMVGALGEDANGNGAGAAYVHYLGCNPVCTTISSPLNGGVSVPLDTDISWFAVEDATSYSISVGTTSGGSDIIDNQDVGNVLTFDLPNDLSIDTEYFVNITPSNPAGNASSCIESSFTTSVIPMTLNIGANVTIPCYEPVPVESYIVNNLCNAATVTVETEITDGDCDAEYTVVRTYTATDGCTTISDVQTIIVVDNEGPEFANVPEDVILACGADLPTDMPTATDDCDTGGITVTFDDSPAPTCGQVVTRTFTAIDQCGNVSTVVQLITIESGDGLPSCSVLEAPTGDSVPLNVDLMWSAAADAAGYILYVGTTSGGVDVVDSVDVGNVLTYSLINLMEGTTYYVSVTPYNEIGSAVFCSEFEFTTGSLPVCSDVIGPDNSTLVNPLGATITWTESPDAAGYFLTVGTTPGGDDILSDEDVADVTSYVLDLPQLSSIYASVVAYNEFGISFGCLEYEFETDIIIGIEETTVNDVISIYPNPNSGNELFISTGNIDLSNNNQIVITNQLGQVVSQFNNLRSNSNTVKIVFDQKLSAGMYNVLLQNDNKNYNSKVIVK